MENNYYVCVGNIGNIQCDTRIQALKVFSEYVNQSKNGYGRASGESVCVFKNDEIIKDYIGTLEEFAI